MNDQDGTAAPAEGRLARRHRLLLEAAARVRAVVLQVEGSR